MEEYIGVKFEVIKEPGRIPKKELDLVLKIDRALGKYLKPKENEGNISVRTENGFLIKKSGVKLTKLKKDDVVLVHKVGLRTVYCTGGTPSSESRMHADIYKNVPSAKMILHFHCDTLLGKSGFVRVGPFSYGSLALARSVGKAAKDHAVIEIIRHGFVIVASEEDAVFKMLSSLPKQVK